MPQSVAALPKLSTFLRPGSPFVVAGKQSTTSVPISVRTTSDDQRFLQSESNRPPQFSPTRQWLHVRPLSINRRLRQPLPACGAAGGIYAEATARRKEQDLQFPAIFCPIEPSSGSNTVRWITSQRMERSLARAEKGPDRLHHKYRRRANRVWEKDLVGRAAKDLAGGGSVCGGLPGLPRQSGRGAMAADGRSDFNSASRYTETERFRDCPE